MPQQSHEKPPSIHTAYGAGDKCPNAFYEDGAREFYEINEKKGGSRDTRQSSEMYREWKNISFTSPTFIVLATPLLWSSFQHRFSSLFDICTGP